ncbi:protein of unknown function [Burkholderia multivorans]
MPLGAEEGTQGACGATVAAPATVSSEPASASRHWLVREGPERAPTCQPGDLPARKCVRASRHRAGCTDATAAARH